MYPELSRRNTMMSRKNRSTKEFLMGRIGIFILAGSDTRSPWKNLSFW